MILRWCVLVSALLLVLASAPAHAADELSLSRDGVTWAPEMADPLFDSSVRWVPGDVRTESFFVRNETPQAGRLAIDIVGTPVHTLLDTGDLDIDARGAGGDWVSVSTPGTHQLLSGGSVPAGSERRVDVTVSLDPASSNQSQVRSLDLALKVQLVQSVDDATSDGGKDSDDGNSLLPDTGGPARWFVAVGVALVLAGAMVARRRREGVS